jgi:flagellin-like protein
MDLKSLVRDDDAVSPVIGVILMVAITVILAAVIASFVIGLGDSNQQTAPSVSFSTDYEASGGSGTLTITADNVGESVQQDNLRIAGDGASTIPGDWTSFTGGSSGSDLSAGDSIEITGVGTGYDISIVYNDPNNDESYTLQEDITGPDA